MAWSSSSSSWAPARRSQQMASCSSRSSSGKALGHTSRRYVGRLGLTYRLRGLEGLENVEELAARPVEQIEQRLAEGEGRRVLGVRVLGDGVVVERDGELH